MFVVVLSEGRMYPNAVAFVEVSTCCWFKRVLRALLAQYSVLQRSKVKGMHVYATVDNVCSSVSTFHHCTSFIFKPNNAS